ncbi:ferredoxin [Nocardioides sp.]|uniref:ferredoxin n=1 Tax=Nocardioides sp. TaxID=35761 RepID=UPI00261F997E|nr:ferredoxin [Nocardioides sp.]
MSRIAADLGTCEGIGMCEAQAHQYFRVSDDDLVEVLAEEVPEADRVLVHRAVESCPVFALKLLD